MSQILLNQFSRLFFHFLGKSVANQRLCVKAILQGIGFKGRVIIPSGSTGALSGSGMVIGHTDGFRAAAECGRDPRGQPKAGGTAYHQYVFTSGHSALGFHIGDLIRDMARAADRMGGGADKSSGFWFYNHEKAS